MNDCTRMKILKDAYNSASKLHKGGLLLSLVCFIISMVATMHSVSNAEQINEIIMYISIILFALFEFTFLFLAERALKNLNHKNYSFLEQSQVPPENLNHQKTRYLKFRSQLKKADIGANSIETIIDVLKAREELEEVSGTYVKRFFGFFMALIITLTVSLIKDFEFEVVKLIFVFGGLIGFLIFAIASMIPAKIERILELKYFLVMYEKQLKQDEAVSSKMVKRNDDLVAIV